jgi:hypothetical protein
MTQPQLALLPRVRQKAAEMMDSFLSELQDGEWHTRSALAARLHTSDRAIRMCAEHSQGRVISDQRGMKLTRYATVAEVDHAEAWLISQGRKMIDRAREIRIARNRGVAA